MPRRQLSKRKRRVQNAQQRKRCRKGAQPIDILSPELLSELGGAGGESDGNALVLGTKAVAIEESGEEAQGSRKLSKSELRKMKQVSLSKQRV